MSSKARKDTKIPGHQHLVDKTLHAARKYINTNGEGRDLKQKLAPKEDYKHPHRYIYDGNKIIAHVWCVLNKQTGLMDVFVQEEP